MKSEEMESALVEDKTRRLPRTAENTSWAIPIAAFLCGAVPLGNYQLSWRVLETEQEFPSLMMQA